MTEQEILDGLRTEWEKQETTDERRAEIATEVQNMAEGQSMACMRCKKMCVYLPHDHALIQGHVYSHDGLAEYQITKLCEFCFDEVTKEPDEECTCDLMAHPCEVHDCQGGAV